MESNEITRNQIFEVIENQIRDNDPPETNLTYKRLKKLGYSDFECKQYIGQCVAVEIYNVIKNKKPFDKDRFIKNLKKLPEEPFDK